MEHQKELNLLNEPNDSKLVTRKWNIVNDQSDSNFEVGNEIVYNTEVLKRNLCDYNDTYNLVRCYITVTVAPAIQVSFKNCATNVSQKLMEQKQMMLKIQSCQCII